LPTRRTLAPQAGLEAGPPGKVELPLDQRQA